MSLLLREVEIGDLVVMPLKPPRRAPLLGIRVHRMPTRSVKGMAR